MSAETDWLDRPEVPPVTDSPVAIVADPLAERDARLVSLLPCLTPKQQAILQSLRHYKFNIAKTLRILETSGDSVDAGSYYRWLRTDPNFKFAVETLKAQALEAIDPSRTLLRLDEIAEEALRPKAVYFKGAPTGEKRKDYAASLKATELQMKQQKLLGEEKETGGFGGRTINLTVQVVMPNGELRDAKRAGGVVIDMPAIEVPDAS